MGENKLICHNQYSFITLIYDNKISLDSILVWTNEDILTQEQFDSIQLPNSWTKNKPRDGMPNFGRFLRSPDASQDVDFTTEEDFGLMMRLIIVKEF